MLYKALFKHVALFVSLVFAGFMSYAKAHEWLYPVSGVDDIHLYVIHQTSLHHIELWKWNVITHQADKVLLSTFIPAGLAMLPGRGGFSFIDRDMIRIKEHIKRSPKTIPLDAPLYNFTQIQWITDTCAYLSAQERGRFGIYQIDVEGRTWCIQGDDVYDYMYPQKIDDRLFYVQRSGTGSQVMTCAYPELEAYGPEYEYYKYAYRDKQTEVELVSTMSPLIFIKMVNQEEGYVISHESSIDHKQDSVKFTMLRLYCAHDQWQMDECFSFFIPTWLLIGHDRLYESLLPCLPYSHKSTIYFVSYEDNSMNLYSYNYDTGVRVQLTHYDHECLCSPCYINNSLYYGGVLKDCDTLSMYIDDHGVKISLFEFTPKC